MIERGAGSSPSDSEVSGNTTKSVSEPSGSYSYSYEGNDDEYPLTIGFKGPHFKPDITDDVLDLVDSVEEIGERVRPLTHLIEEGRTLFILLQSFPLTSFPELLRKVLADSVHKEPIKTNLRCAVFTQQGPYRINPPEVRGGCSDLVSRTRSVLNSLYTGEGANIDPKSVKLENKGKSDEEGDNEAQLSDLLSLAIMRRLIAMLSTCDCVDDLYLLPVNETIGKDGKMVSGELFERTLAATIGCSPFLLSIEFMNYEDENDEEIIGGRINILVINPAISKDAIDSTKLIKFENKRLQREKQRAYLKKLKSISLSSLTYSNQVRNEIASIAKAANEQMMYVQEGEEARPVEFAAATATSMLGNASCGIDICVRGAVAEATGIAYIVGAGFIQPDDKDAEDEFMYGGIPEVNGYSHAIAQGIVSFPRLGNAIPNYIRLSKYEQLMIQRKRLLREIEELRRKLARLREMLEKLEMTKDRVGIDRRGC